MATKKDTIWPIDPHTQRKHEILRRYFEAWLPIMGQWAGRVLFIDGFAGPGKYQGGEDGSPAIVLKAARDHKYPPKGEVVFIFVEADKDRFEHLEQVIAGLKPTLPKKYSVECVHGRFDEHLKGVLKQLDVQKKQLAPALVFVDPFGFSHTPFATIVGILQNKYSEGLITFMYEEINRFIGQTDYEQTYDELFGTTKWRDVLPLTDPNERRRLIHDIYLAQLRTSTQYVRSFEMLNHGNRTDYFLFFASNGLRGVEKMKEAMWRIDPGGTFQFSDFTDALGMMTLFGNQPDFVRLKELILGKFKNATVSVEDLGDFVVAETPFLRTHFKVQLLKPMEQAGELVVESAKVGRKKGTFPAGTKVHFK